MVSWGWIPVALLIGVCAGALIMGLCAANSQSEGKKWWEDE